MLRQNVSVIGVLATSGSFTKNIFCNFTPDEIIVKNLFFLDDGTGVDTFQVRSDIIADDNILGFVSDNAVMHQQAVHFKGKMLNGSYTFSVLTSAGALASLTGEVSMQLEFVKY